MPNAIASAVEGMQSDLRRLETISQNIVNTATPGYRRTVPPAQVFDGAMLAAAPGTPDSVRVQPEPLALLDLSHGALRQTKGSFDIAIGGEGYFELATAHGPAYTRAGDFRLDALGKLVSSHGFAVQGMGGDIVLNGADAAIDAEGHIRQDGQVVAQIKVMRFDGRTPFVKSADGLLQGIGGNSGEVDRAPQLQVGFLEGSNVSTMREMVMLMETTRHFEAVQKVFQGYDSMLGSAIQKLGEF